MGLQILPADIPPPALIRGDSAPQLPAKDDTSRFDGYLNDARSAVDTEPETQRPDAPRPEADPSTDVDEIDADAVPLADQAGETTDDDSTDATPPNIAIGPELYVPPSYSSEPPVESSQFPRQQPTAITPNPLVETSEQGSSQPAPAGSSQPVQTLPQQATISGQNVEQLTNQDTLSAPTSEATAQSDRTTTKTLSDQPHEVRESADAPSQQTQKATDQTRAPVQSLAPDQSRARKEAVDASQPTPSNSRLAATQRGALTPAPPNPLTDTSQLAPDQSRARKGAVRVTIPIPKSVTLKAGKGDGAAAAFAKFLVTPANQTGPGSAGNAAAHTSTGIGQAISDVASAPGANQAPIADLVADLLAARVDDADAIKGAARVLNASGRSGKFEVTMQLDPPELGQIKLHIQMRQQGLTLRVDAQTQAVAKLIESRLTELSDVLALHGIRVDRAEVTVRSAGSTQADTQSSQDNGPSNRGDFNQASTQDQGGSDQGEAASYQTADQHLSDPKHPVEELDGGSYQDDLIALAGHGAETNDAITPATELSVNLVA